MSQADDLEYIFIISEAYNSCLLDLYKTKKAENSELVEE